MTHFIVAAGLGLAFTESARLRATLSRWAIPVTAGLFGAAPDLDTWNTIAFGVPDDTLFSHRGFFHAPFFLAVLALAIAAGVARRRGPILPLAAFWACAAITHPLLDMLTDGGLGVTLLYPFSADRLFFAWRPIRVSPLDIELFIAGAAEIFWSELPFCAAAILLGLSLRAITGRATEPPRSPA